MSTAKPTQREMIDKYRWAEIFEQRTAQHGSQPSITDFVHDIQCDAIAATSADKPVAQDVKNGLRALAEVILTTYKFELKDDEKTITTLMWLIEGSRYAQALATTPDSRPITRDVQKLAQSIVMENTVTLKGLSDNKAEAVVLFDNLVQTISEALAASPPVPEQEPRPLREVRKEYDHFWVLHRTLNWMMCRKRGSTTFEALSNGHWWNFESTDDCLAIGIRKPPPPVKEVG